MLKLIDTVLKNKSFIIRIYLSLKTFYSVVDVVAAQTPFMSASPSSSGLLADKSPQTAARRRGRAPNIPDLRLLRRLLTLPRLLRSRPD